MIKMLEDYKPVCQCPPEYQDVDGIVKYVQVYFIGHLSAMLKIKISMQKCIEQRWKSFVLKIRF